MDEVREEFYLTLVMAALEGSLRLGFFFLTSSSSSYRYCERGGTRFVSLFFVKDRHAWQKPDVSGKSDSVAIQTEVLLVLIFSSNI